MTHHEDTKGTKGTKPSRPTHKELWVDESGFVPFVPFVSSW